MGSASRHLSVSVSAALAGGQALERGMDTGGVKTIGNAKKNFLLSEIDIDLLPDEELISVLGRGDADAAFEQGHETRLSKTDNTANNNLTEN